MKTSSHFRVALSPSDFWRRISAKKGSRTTSLKKKTDVLLIYYCKKPQNLDTQKMAVIILKFETMFYHKLVCLKDADGKANSVDPDQIAPSGSGSTLFAQTCLSKHELPHDKNKVTVCPAKTQISLGIPQVWSESSPCAQWVAKDPSFLHADSEDWSDWAGTHADLSLRREHMQFWWFCREVAQIFRIITASCLGKRY